MSWSEPTRVVSLLALACICGSPSACQHADPKAAPSAEAPQPVLATAAPATVATAMVPAASVTPPAPKPLQLAAPEPAPPSSVLVIGDSLSDERVGGGGFVAALRKRCPSLTFDNRAKGGFMVNQMRRRLETELLPQGAHYSHAIVFGGVNDLYSDQTANRSLARIESDLARIYAALELRGIQVIAITVTPWGGFKRWYTPARAQSTQALNAWIKGQVSEGKLKALDAYPLLSCGDPERLCPQLAAPHKDGLHFGKLGHQKLAQALYDLAFSGCQEPPRETRE